MVIHLLFATCGTQEDAQLVIGSICRSILIWVVCTLMLVWYCCNLAVGIGAIEGVTRIVAGMSCAGILPWTSTPDCSVMHSLGKTWSHTSSANIIRVILSDRILSAGALSKRWDVGYWRFHGGKIQNLVEVPFRIAGHITERAATIHSCVLRIPYTQCCRFSRNIA